MKKSNLKKNKNKKISYTNFRVLDNIQDLLELDFSYIETNKPTKSKKNIYPKRILENSQTVFRKSSPELDSKNKGRAYSKCVHSYTHVI